MYPPDPPENAFTSKGKNKIKGKRWKDKEQIISRFM